MKVKLSCGSTNCIMNLSSSILSSRIELSRSPTHSPDAYTCKSPFHQTSPQRVGQDLPCFITNNIDNTDNAESAQSLMMLRRALGKHRATFAGAARLIHERNICVVFTPSLARSLDIHVARLFVCWFRKIFNVETTIIKKEFCKFSKPKFVGGDDTAVWK